MTETVTPSAGTIDPVALKAKYLAERDKRLRADGVEQYIPVDGAFSHFAADPYVKRIEDTIGIPQVVDTLAEASRQISQAMGAVTETTDIEASAVPTRRRTTKK